jgi:hypothetical protein
MERMGHYRSEMGFEDEDRRAAEAEAKRVADLTTKIQSAIDSKGVARKGGYCYLDYRSDD